MELLRSPGEIACYQTQSSAHRYAGPFDVCHVSIGRLHAAREDGLLYFDGERYDLERFVIMPNHLHLLIQMRADFQLRKQLTETMRYTGRKVNAFLKQEETFWQSEPFDHVVRSEEQFEYLQAYIDDNPQKARLSKDEYILWIRK